MQTILFALWFFLPAGIANMAPVIAKKIPMLHKLAVPVDGGKSFRGRRIFGDHKTVRGFVVGVLSALVIVLMQMFLYAHISWVKTIAGPVDYSEPVVILLGIALGFGALAGDAIKSFFKRQVGVPSGASWFPYDQIDYIVGGILLSLPFYTFSMTTYLAVFLVWFLIHPIATLIAWLLKLKDSPI